MNVWIGCVVCAVGGAAIGAAFAAGLGYRVGRQEGYDDGHLVGFVDGRDHHHRERTAQVRRAADARVDHPSTKALFDQID